MLVVRTARVWYTGLDRIDVTRATGLVAFAPSWELLRWYKNAKLRAVMGHNVDLAKEEWAVFAERYLAEMRASYKANRQTWDWLLSQDRVVLVCYCPQRDRCHAGLLASEVLPKLGAVYEGEIEVQE